MSDHNCEIVQQDDHCRPAEPCPQPEPEPCKGEVIFDCCCPRLNTRTFVINIGPQSEPQLQAFVQNTASAWEAANYSIHAVNVLDTGAGWMLTITVGWYA